MKINVYLPDDIGEKAKEAGLNLSGLLREGVEAELHRRERLGALLKDVEVYELTIQDGSYIARLHGKLLTPDNEKVEVYLTEEEELVIYDPREGRLHGECEVSDLHSWLDDNAYIAVAAALGEEAVIDYGKAS